jgi:hypothetical protein
MQERPKRSNDKRKPLRQAKCPHVAIDRDNPLSNFARLRGELLSESCEHPRIGVECMNSHATVRQRKRNPPGAGAEFENRASALLRLAEVPVGITEERLRCHEVVKIRFVAHFHVGTLSARNGTTRIELEFFKSCPR